MNTKRALSLRKEVLTELADTDLGLVGGAAIPESFPSLCNFTCLTCNWTCLCLDPD